MTLKTCSKCGIPKARDYYNRDRSKADGLQQECRACYQQRRKKYAPGTNITRESLEKTA